jgi:hypothetical protein
MYHNRRNTPTPTSLSSVASSGSFGTLPGYPPEAKPAAPAGNQIRQLPGYHRQADSPSLGQAPQTTPLPRQGTGTPLAIPQSAVAGKTAVPNPFSPLNAPAQPPKPYQSREKPYYLPNLPTAKPSAGQPSSVSTAAGVG